MVCKDLVCVSLYDTKPVYILSNCCDGIRWIKKERKVFSKEKGKEVIITFYRLNVIEYYNYNMGSVDLADQLWNHYRYDTACHRNRKWWWSIWWWAFQGLLTNSYIVYSLYHRLHDSKKIISHYDYIKAIALAWIEPALHRPKPPLQGGIIQTTTRKRTRYNSDTSTISPISYSDSQTASFDQKHNVRVTESNLHPNTGKLSCRLRTDIQHIPVASKSKRARCQLHRWASGKEVMSCVMTCLICGVDLCLQCYSLFHKEANLVDFRCQIAN